jgi:Fic family protein
MQFDTNVVTALSEADRKLGELAGLGRALPNPHLLARPFIRQEAVLSSRIEGTQTDIAELYAYEAHQLEIPGFAGQPRPDAHEVANYVAALEYGLQRLAEIPTSLRLIREVHQRLMQGVRGNHHDAGQFRPDQVWIGPPGSSLQEATYVPPPVPEMALALDNLEQYLHSDDPLPPLIRLALIHYQFEAIHPFRDGNGRLGRLMMPLLLVEWGHLPAPLLYLSAYFERHRDQYYQRLLQVSERSAWQEWLLFFLQAVAQQAGEAAIEARRLQDLHFSWRQALQGTKAPGWTLDLVDILLVSPVLTALVVREQCGVSHPAAMQALRRLEALGIVREVAGRGRSRLFVAAAVLPDYLM